MIDIPLKPVIPYTARSLAESLGATVVIRLNANRQRFEGFTISHAGPGFPIEGGNGYIVNVTESKTVSFVGSTWTNKPPVEMAPSVTDRTSAWAFVFSGALSNADAVGAGYRISVTNQRTGVTMSDTISSDGTFAAVAADLSRKSVVELNDTLEVVLQDAQGKVVSGPYTFKVTPEAIEKAYLSVTLPFNGVIPQKTALWQNYPNPFNPETWIPYSLATSADVMLRIYDASGQLIRTFAIGHRDAGEYIKPGKAAYWDGRNERGELVSSGVYFYTFQSGSFTASRKMVIIK
ncbi:T9SS type A sorting domain-containing protein [Candidatus Poribacteria bacterium]|nr:T9SS type A sorting domain-containing protein [Candidatus Poribacteria bacterium]